MNMYLQAGVSDASGNMDVYPQKFGIRSIGWNSTTLTINNKPMYLRGFGKHEDSDVSSLLFNVLFFCGYNIIF